MGRRQDVGRVMTTQAALDFLAKVGQEDLAQGSGPSSNGGRSTGVKGGDNPQEAMEHFRRGEVLLAAVGWVGGGAFDLLEALEDGLGGCVVGDVLSNVEVLQLLR